MLHQPKAIKINQFLYNPYSLKIMPEIKYNRITRFYDSLPKLRLLNPMFTFNSRNIIYMELRVTKLTLELIHGKNTIVNSIVNNNSINNNILVVANHNSIANTIHSEIVIVLAVHSFHKTILLHMDIYDTFIPFEDAADDLFALTNDINVDCPRIRNSMDMTENRIAELIYMMRRLEGYITIPFYRPYPNYHFEP